MGQVDPGDGAAAAMVRESYRSERTVSGAYAPVLSAAGAAGQGTLKDQLAVVARAVNLGVPTAMYSAGLGGFDTHAGERSTHQGLLASFDDAVSSFFAAIEGNPHGREVVLVAYSEFGRRVRANAAQGTDHGTAGPVFVIGSGVRPGFHGEPPSLTDLDAGDLRYTTDFRAVYGELLEKVLRADPGPILGRSYPALGVLR
jgi:uncharacterized protein (DUF1501 family)